VLVRFAYLAVAHAFAVLRLLLMSDREKDVEILVLRHQLTVLQRQLGDRRPRLRPEDRLIGAAAMPGRPRVCAPVARDGPPVGCSPAIAPALVPARGGTASAHGRISAVDRASGWAVHYLSNERLK
jgi:hypothetical protein